MYKTDERHGKRVIQRNVEEKRGTGKGGIKMSSREEILASIRKHTQTRYEKPDIADMKRLTYPDKIEQFCAISRAGGGTAVVLGEGEDVNAVIRRTYPDVPLIRYRFSPFMAFLSF